MDPLAEFAIFVANLGVSPESDAARKRVTLDGLIHRASAAIARANTDDACVQCGMSHFRGMA